MKRNKITLLLAAFLLVCGCSDFEEINVNSNNPPTCLLYTSDAADER